MVHCVTGDPSSSATARTRRRLSKRPKWVLALAVCIAAGFLPWIIYLALTIPDKSVDENYGLAWVGFDCALWIVIAALATTAFQGHHATGTLATIAGTMFVVDAWFDVFSSSPRHGALTVALLFAICGELPLAGLCFWSAAHSNRLRHHPSTVDLPVRPVATVGATAKDST